MEDLSTMSGITLGVLGGLAAIVNIIVEIGKDFFPKIPTRLVALITSLIVCLLYSLVTLGGFNLNAVASGIFSGFVVAYVAMNGFDVLKDIGSRFDVKIKEGDDGEEL